MENDAWILQRAFESLTVGPHDPKDMHLVHTALWGRTQEIALSDHLLTIAHVILYSAPSELYRDGQTVRTTPGLHYLLGRPPTVNDKFRIEALSWIEWIPRFNAYHSEFRVTLFESTCEHCHRAIYWRGRSDMPGTMFWSHHPTAVGYNQCQLYADPGTQGAQ